MGTGVHDPGLFIHSILKPVRIIDIVNLLAKTLLPGILTAVICCMEGLTIRGVATEVPQAATRAVVRSISGLIIISALVSVLTYM